MKTIKVFSIAIFFGLAMLGLKAQPLQSTMELVENTPSSSVCGPFSNCMDSIICFRIMLTPDTAATVLSYNIWIDFPVEAFSFVSDAVCLTQYGSPNDQFLFQGNYRVSGVLGVTPVAENVPIALHTVCLKYLDLEAVLGNTITVGGSVFGLLSTLTYTNPSASEPNMPVYPFVMDETNISCLVVLSANLLSFDARKSGERAILNWVTTEEHNVARYDVERSVDGLIFEPIGSLPARGDVDKTHHYEFIDQNPARGINYYRIRQVDRDGQYNYSQIRSLVFGSEFFYVRAWPNPVSDDNLHIEIMSDSGVGSELSLISTSGQSVGAWELGEGDQSTTLDLTSLTPGVYSLVVRSEGYRHIERIVVLR
jgi:hypothetical protein